MLVSRCALCCPCPSSPSMDVDPGAKLGCSEFTATSLSRRVRGGGGIWAQSPARTQASPRRAWSACPRGRPCSKPFCPTSSLNAPTLAQGARALESGSGSGSLGHGSVGAKALFPLATSPLRFSLSPSSSFLSYRDHTCLLPTPSSTSFLSIEGRGILSGPNRLTTATRFPFFSHFSQLRRSLHLRDPANSVGSFRIASAQPATTNCNVPQPGRLRVYHTIISQPTYLPSSNHHPYAYEQLSLNT